MPLTWTHHPEFSETLGLDDYHLASDGRARFVITRESIDGHFPAHKFWLYVYQHEEDMEGNYGEYSCEEFDTVDECKTAAHDAAEELRGGPMDDNADVNRCVSDRWRQSLDRSVLECEANSVCGELIVRLCVRTDAMLDTGSTDLTRYDIEASVVALVVQQCNIILHG